MHRRTILATLALSLSILAAAPAHAQDTWARQVSRLLANASSVAASNGLQLTHEPWIGSLGDGESSRHGITLQGGTTYALVGVCDNDCTDVDFRLFDPNGNEVASDVATDDTPVISITPRRSGQYTLQVVMADCRAEPCRYGIGVYGR
jgi:hypothetical protein